MPRPRFKKLDAKRRDTIMEAAAKIFAENGYQGASINQILQQAGLSKGVAYYYFEDKADLFATTIEFYLSQIDIDVQQHIARLEADTFWDVMLQLYSEPFLQNLDAPYRFQVLKTAIDIQHTDPLYERIAPLLQKAFGWTIEFVNKGQAFGLVRTDLPDELLYGFINSIDEVADRYILERIAQLNRDEIYAIQSQVVDTIRRLLSP
ncbi:MAG: TetR/AcrR family transcriptional regulator [Phototrophicaceae bacterium]